VVSIKTAPVKIFFYKISVIFPFAVLNAFQTLIKSETARKNCGNFPTFYEIVR
jgi:hypothetical protein